MKKHNVETIMSSNELGQIHSYDDQPAVVRKDGTKFWYKDGRLHRIGGPARISGTTDLVWWMEDGQHHRIDGPACIGKGETYLWWVRGNPYVTNTGFQRAAGLSDEQMLSLVLKYGNVNE